MTSWCSRDERRGVEYGRGVIVAAAVCPPPPALVPRVGVGLAELEPVRAAAHAAVESLLGQDPERVVVIGPDRIAVDADEGAGGTFARFGVDLTAGGGNLVLPAAYTVGAWLLDAAGWTGPRHYTSSRPEPGDRDVLLVMADADTSAGVSAPTHGDPRAAGLADIVAKALDTGDAAALAGLDVDLAREWEGTGVPALQLLGELIERETAKGASITAHLRSDEAPFGVRYWVADWQLTG